MKIGNKTKVTREITRQERNRRNNIKRLVISACFALLVFVALIVIQNSILNQEKKETVYQVIKDIDVGTKITENNINDYLDLKEVQVSLIPSGYITAPEDVQGKFVNREYKVNDIITSDGVTDTENLYTKLIENPIEITFSTDDIASAVGGTIREGDYINIYGLRKPTAENNPSAENLYLVDEDFTFQHVYVTKVFDSSGKEVVIGDENSESNSVVTIISVILSENDIEQFNEMLKNCSIKVTKLLYNSDEDYTKFLDKANKNAAKFTSSNLSDEDVTELFDTEALDGENTEEITENVTDENDEQSETPADTSESSTETDEENTENTENADNSTTDGTETPAENTENGNNSTTDSTETPAENAETAE